MPGTGTGVGTATGTGREPPATKILAEIAMAGSVKEKLKRKRAQSALEYTVIIACVVMGLVAMTKYIRRSMQGKLREAMDELGQQYHPEKTRGAYSMISSSSVREQTKTQTELNVDIDLDEDQAKEDVVLGTTSNQTISSAVERKCGHEAIYE